MVISHVFATTISGFLMFSNDHDRKVKFSRVISKAIIYSFQDNLDFYCKEKYNFNN